VCKESDPKQIWKVGGTQDKVQNDDLFANKKMKRNAGDGAPLGATPPPNLVPDMTCRVCMRFHPQSRSICRFRGSRVEGIHPGRDHKQYYNWAAHRLPCPPPLPPYPVGLAAAAEVTEELLTATGATTARLVSP
jgi:hypothetical protein